METRPPVIVRHVTSIASLATQARVVQGQSQIAPNEQPSQAFPTLQPPVAHQNRVNLPIVTLGTRPNDIPLNSPVPLDLTSGAQQFPEPVPQQNISQMFSKRCRCMKVKCSHVQFTSPTTLPHDETPATVRITMEELEKIKKELQECEKRLLEQELKVQDLTNLAEGQGDAMGKIHGQLNWFKVQNKNLDNMVTKLLGEIARLNDVVDAKNRAVAEYQNTVAEYKACCEKLKEHENLLEGKLKETSEFLKNVNGEFKGEVGSLTSEYCEHVEDEGEEEEEEEENVEKESEAAVTAATSESTIPDPETQSVIELVDLERETFLETASVLVEFVEMGVEECLKRKEPREEENKEELVVEKVPVPQPQVAKILLKKVTSESSGESSPNGSSQSEYGEWSIVNLAEGEQGGGEEEKLEDGEDMLENSMGLEPFLTFLPLLPYPFSEEIVETTVEETSGMKRKWSADEDDEESVYDEGDDFDDDDDDQDDDAGTKKVRYEVEGENTTCELLGGEKDLGQCITLHYTGSDEEEVEDEDDEIVVIKEVVRTKAGINQPEAEMDDDLSSSSSSDGDLTDEYSDDDDDDDDSGCSKFFCVRCFTPFPNQTKVDQHYESKKKCTSMGGKTDGDNEAEDMKESKNDDTDFELDEEEDELLDI